MRIEPDVERGPAFDLLIDGVSVQAFEGETIATILFAQGVVAFRGDGDHRSHGVFCNMGTCSECMVLVAAPGRCARRVRACMTDAAVGQEIFTGAQAHG
jgi:D-hydroxyproline dehydrogenase subunit gamma